MTVVRGLVDAARLTVGGLTEAVRTLVGIEPVYGWIALGIFASVLAGVALGSAA